MDSVRVSAWAKLNISLDVISRMENGFHELCMVMQSVSLCDDVDISIRSGSGKISVFTDKAYLPRGEQNIAGKAARAFCGSCNVSDADIEIKIKKRIPVCAGLGGGSSDAAAVLRGLNKLTKAGMTLEELEQIGAGTGSDVPYCVRCGTVLAKGRGEQMTDLPPMPDCAALICKPRFSISTPELFGKIDCRKIRCRPDTEGIISALSRGDVRGVSRRMYNVFEDVLSPEYDEIGKIKHFLIEHGAMGAAMSGTGSAVFGLFENGVAAEKACAELRRYHKACFVAGMTEKNSI